MIGYKNTQKYASYNCRSTYLSSKRNLLLFWFNTIECFLSLDSCNRDGLIAAVVVLIIVTLVTPVIVFIIIYEVLHKRELCTT